MPNNLDKKPRYIYALRGMSADDLRRLLFSHGDSTSDISLLNEESLRSTLSDLAPKNLRLQKELKKSEIKLKPSFYLLLLSSKSNKLITATDAKRKMLSAITELNNHLNDRSSTPTYKEFRLESIYHTKKSLVQAELSWHRIYWYWEAPTLRRAEIYEMQFGYVFVDFENKKAIISCHTLNERDYIMKILESSYPISLSPLVLTRPLLEQIGSFAQLKRGGYFFPSSSSKRPSNIVYADENLGTKIDAREMENDPDAQRKYSFYQIPLGSIVEHGVGATSDSGKLWISREIPLSTIRQYSFELLGKVSKTLDHMSKKGQLDRVLQTFGIPRLPRIARIKNKRVKAEICNLFSAIVNMIITGQSERPYLVNETLAIEAVPQFFMYPRLQLTDPKTEDIAFWSDESRTSQFVQIIRDRDSLAARAYPSDEKLSLHYLTHPITNESVAVSNVLQSLELIPTPELIDTLTQAISHVSQQIEKLATIVCLPIQINAGVLRLDLRRAQGKSGLASIGDEIKPTDVKGFHQLLRHRIAETRESQIAKTLNRLGEKCVHMSDSNCKACVSQRRYLCLRSLVGRYLIDPQILAHKESGEGGLVGGERSETTDGVKTEGGAKHQCSSVFWLSRGFDCSPLLVARARCPMRPA